MKILPANIIIFLIKIKFTKKVKSLKLISNVIVKNFHRNINTVMILTYFGTISTPNLKNSLTNMSPAKCQLKGIANLGLIEKQNNFQQRKRGTSTKPKLVVNKRTLINISNAKKSASRNVGKHTIHT